jgi:hypothetical protein
MDTGSIVRQIGKNPLKNQFSIEGADESSFSPIPMSRVGARKAAVPASTSEHLRFSHTGRNIISDIRSPAFVNGNSISRKNRKSADCAADRDSPKLLYATGRTRLIAITTNLVAVYVEDE